MADPSQNSRHDPPLNVFAGLQYRRYVDHEYTHTINIYICICINPALAEGGGFAPPPFGIFAITTTFFELATRN